MELNASVFNIYPVNLLCSTKETITLCYIFNTVSSILRTYYCDSWIAVTASLLALNITVVNLTFTGPCIILLAE